VDLPKIEMIRLQTAQRFFEHAKGDGFIAAMSTDLGHEKDLPALAFEPAAHPNFGLAAVVLPAVIEECDAAVNCASDQLVRGLLVLGVAEMVTAESES